MQLVQNDLFQVVFCRPHEALLFIGHCSPRLVIEPRDHDLILPRQWDVEDLALAHQNEAPGTGARRLLMLSQLFSATPFDFRRIRDENEV